MVADTETNPFNDRDTDPHYNKPYDLEGIEVIGSEQVFLASLQALEQAFTKHKVQIFCDFDQTLAPTNSWVRAAEAFEPGSELARKSEEERAKHLKLQRDEALSPIREDEWTRAEIGRHAVNGTTSSTLAEIAAETTLYAGARELISLFQSLGLGFHIVSAGHGEFIEAVLENEHITVDPEDVIANRAAAPKAMLVNGRNKRRHIDTRFPQDTDMPDYTIAIGDALPDAVMGDNLRIRTAQASGNTPEYLTKSRQAFDCVLSTKDLMPLVHLFTQVAEHADILDI